MGIVSGPNEIYEVTFKNEQGNVVSKYSDMIPINGAIPNVKESEYIFNEVSVIINEKDNTISDIKPKKSKFIKNENIISFKKVSDLALKKKIGTWKSLDTFSVEQYMYSKSLKKLKLNREFEEIIKQNSIDCVINKYGNIIRLEECYEPYNINESLYVLYYENYSTGERFKRLNVRSEYSPGLPENVFTIQDILNNVARKSREFTFINVNSTEEFTFPESLIISENIDCEQFDYNFEDIPPKIKNLAIKIADLTGFTGNVTWDANRPDGTPRKILDSTKINKLGWKPLIPLDEGIKSNINWYKENYSK
jgi:hypothetical protein